jgi:hypothetical protein
MGKHGRSRAGSVLPVPQALKSLPPHQHLAPAPDCRCPCRARRRSRMDIGIHVSAPGRRFCRRSAIRVVVQHWRSATSATKRMPPQTTIFVPVQTAEGRVRPTGLRGIPEPQEFAIGSNSPRRSVRGGARRHSAGSITPRSACGSRVQTAVCRSALPGRPTWRSSARCRTPDRRSRRSGSDNPGAVSPPQTTMRYTRPDGRVIGAALRRIRRRHVSDHESSVGRIDRRRSWTILRPHGADGSPSKTLFDPRQSGAPLRRDRVRVPRIGPAPQPRKVDGVFPRLRSDGGRSTARSPGRSRNSRSTRTGRTSTLRSGRTRRSRARRRSLAKTIGKPSAGFRSASRHRTGETRRPRFGLVPSRSR